MTAQVRTGAGAGDAQPGLIVSFVAAGPDAGRTSVLVNLAWTLATAGSRVLVVDLDTHGRRVRDCLPTYPAGAGSVDTLLPADLAHGLSTLLVPAGDDPSTGHRSPYLERHEPVGAAPGGVLDVVLLSRGTARTDDPPRTATVLSTSALRRLLRTADYDYVLVDEPTADPEVRRRIAEMCDTVTVCLNYGQQLVGQAAELAGDITRQATRSLRIVAVTTHVSDLADVQGERDRRHVRNLFLAATGARGDAATDRLNGRSEYRGDVTFVDLPHVEQPDGPLVALAEDGSGRQSLIAGYRTLLAAVSDGTLLEVPAVADAARRRYRFSRGLRSGSEAEAVHLVHRPEDRPWADWIRAQLAPVGIVAPRLRPETSPGGPPAGGTVLLITPAATTGPDTVLTPLSTGERDDRPEILVALVGPGTPVDWPAWTRTVRLGAAAAEDEETARQRLYALLGIARDFPTHPADGWRPRFPVRPAGRPRPLQQDLPRRLRAFTGRAEEVEWVRDELLRSATARAVVIQGPAAIGKSGIARRYIDVFASDYDTVVWLPAHETRTVRAGLARLAQELGIPPMGDPVDQVLSYLRTGLTRWLLVYDGAPASLAPDLLPQGGSGHILVTRTIPVRPAGGDPGDGVINVPPLGRADAVELLRVQARGLSGQSAERLLAAVGGMPLPLRLTSGVLRQAGFLFEVRQGLARSRAADAAVPAFLVALDSDGDKAITTGLILAVDDPVTPAGGQDGQDRLVEILSVAVTLMQRTFVGRLASVVAEMCAFIAPGGISLRILRSDALIEQFAAALPEQDAALLHLDGWELEAALAAGVRFGVFDVDWGTDARLVVHPALQAAMRTVMGPEKAQFRSDRLRRGLARYAPGDGRSGQDERADAELAELQPHLEPSGALTADGPLYVRRWVVHQIGYLYRTEDPGLREEGRRLGRLVLDAWQERVGWQDPLLQRLAIQLANLERAAEHATEAYHLDLLAVEEGARALGPDHLRVLTARRGRAGDERGLGRFEAARDDDRATWESFRAALGNDHPQTLRAAHNYALSLYLDGFVEEALHRESDVLERRRRLFGEDSQPTWWSASNVGMYRCELGDLEEAETLLDEAYEQMRRIRGGNHPATLRIAHLLAVALRRRGHHDRARELHTRTLVSLREVVGVQDAGTIACEFSVAADHHLAGDTAAALDAAQVAMQRCAGLYPNDPQHPFIEICRNGVAVFLAEAGRHDEAVREGRQALDSLTDRFTGQPHPWVLGAALNHAGNLAEAGEPGQARDLLTTTLPLLHRFLSPGHRYVEVAGHGIAALERADGSARPVRRFVDYVDIEVPET